MKKYNVYISGALTGIDDGDGLKEFYEAIALLCHQLKLKPYVPHQHTDPIKNPSITPQEVFRLDKAMVSLADLVIAYVGAPSIGVGMELAYAETLGKPIILLYEENKQISRFPRGISTILAEIKFHSFEDAMNSIRRILESKLSKSAPCIDNPRIETTTVKVPDFACK